jgi:hypothetical protein
VRNLKRLENLVFVSVDAAGLAGVRFQLNQVKRGALAEVRILKGLRLRLGRCDVKYRRTKRLDGKVGWTRVYPLSIIIDWE